jgi:hypothetical protein
VHKLAEAQAYASFLAERAGLPSLSAAWPNGYRNADTGKAYKPHHADEETFVYSDSPRYCLAKGGEGGGKSVAGIVKSLDRLKRGMSGIMGSSDLQHFKKSLWSEFRRWCKPEMVIPSQRYRLKKEWEPQQMFTLTFTTGAQLICGGFDDPSGWEGPNVSFAHWDEARRHKTAAMLKVLDGRCRIPGSNGEPPQIYLTTTPAKHWLYEYFGDVQEDDPFASFKNDALVISLLTRDNEAAGNLSKGFTAQRGQSLTEAEKRVLLEAAWEDIEDATRFVESILLWDACKETLPPLTKHEPLILALDGAWAAKGDVFGGVAVGRHPTRPDSLAVREVLAWEAEGVPRDFEQIQGDIKNFCLDWNVRKIVYDPTQLVQMMQHLGKASKTEDGRDFPGVQTEEFKQMTDRAIADKGLLDSIVSRYIAHSGEPLLRKHLDNADKKVDQNKKLRIVKRTEGQKIDLAVCLSMARARAAESLMIDVTGVFV